MAVENGGCVHYDAVLRFRFRRGAELYAILFCFRKSAGTSASRVGGGGCRVCLKSFKPEDFSRQCYECQQKVCEDCASYSTTADSEDAVSRDIFFQLSFMCILGLKALLILNHCCCCSLCRIVFTAIVYDCFFLILSYNP